MGSDISSNYDSISPIFISGFWKVHSAVHRTTGEVTSLWVLDNQSLQSRCKNRSDQDKYISYCVYSLQQARKLHHPQILKISEVNENPKQLAFSAEPVDSCLINLEASLEADEVEYIAAQLSAAIFFLHHKAKIAHLNISPHSIVLTKSFALKLCGFDHSCNINNMDINNGSLGKVFPKFGEWTQTTSPIYPDINFSAPEMITNKTMTQSCDIFSFACVIASAYLKRHLFAFSTVNEMIRTLSSGVTVAPEAATESMRTLLRNCLKMNPDVRPNIDEIENSEALNTLQLKVYNYIDIILTKSQADKFNFFKSLISSLNIFSQRMLRYKLLPVLMEETLSDNRFGPATIPLIFQIGAFFDRRDFMSNIYQPLSSLITVTKPPEMALAVFSVMRILIDRIDVERHLDTLYPIYTTAFQSNEPRLHAAAVSYLPMIMKSLNTNSLRTLVIPKLNEFITTSQDPIVVANCISALGDCANRIEHDSFAELVLPACAGAWMRLKSDGVGNAITEVIEKLDPMAIETRLRHIVPLVALLLAEDVLDRAAQVKLVAIGREAFGMVAAMRELGGEDESRGTPEEGPQEIARMAQPSMQGKLHQQQNKQNSQKKHQINQQQNQQFSQQNQQFSQQNQQFSQQNQQFPQQNQQFPQQNQQFPQQNQQFPQQNQQFPQQNQQFSQQIQTTDQQSQDPQGSTQQKAPKVHSNLSLQIQQKVEKQAPQKPTLQQQQKIPSWSVKNRPAQPPQQQQPPQQDQLQETNTQQSPFKKLPKKKNEDDFWGDGSQAVQDDDVDAAIVDGILGERDRSQPPLKTVYGQRIQGGKNLRYYNT